MVGKFLTPTARIPMIPTPTTQATETTKSQELHAHLERTVVKPTAPRRNAVLKPIRQIDRLLGIEDRWDKSEPTAGHTKRHERNCPATVPNFKLETPRLHSGIALDRLDTATTKFPPSLEVVWQQLKETSVNH